MDRNVTSLFLLTVRRRKSAQGGKGAIVKPRVVAGAVRPYGRTRAYACANGGRDMLTRRSALDFAPLGCA